MILYVRHIQHSNVLKINQNILFGDISRFPKFHFITQSKSHHGFKDKCLDANLALIFPMLDHSMHDYWMSELNLNFLFSMLRYNKLDNSSEYHLLGDRGEDILPTSQ